MLLLPAVVGSAAPSSYVSLATVRADTLAYCESLRDREGPTGAYRRALRERCDLYSSVDVALMRTIMGEDLSTTLTPEQRAEWVAHLNRFSGRPFGTPRDGPSLHTLGIANSPQHPAPHTLSSATIFRSLESRRATFRAE